MSHSVLRVFSCLSAALLLASSAFAGAVCDPSIASLIGGRSAGLAIDGDVAYVANTIGGLLMYDISDPAQPRAIGAAQTGAWAVGVAAHNGVAYVAAGESGLHIFDVSTPSEPERLAIFETLDRASDVVVDGDVCYVGVGESGIQILDVSNPASPALLGATSVGGGYINNITLDGDVLYAAAHRAGLRIVDVSDSAAPVVIGSYLGVNEVYDVDVFAQQAYLVDEEGFRVLNVQNPASPSLISATLTAGEPRAVAAGEGFALVAQRAAFQIFDTVVPLNPTEIASVDNVQFDATDIILRDGIAYALDDDRGLQIFDVTTPAVPALIGSADFVNRAQGVAIDGTTLAIADLDYGLRLVDVSTPGSPQPLGKFELVRTDGGVEIDGDVVYIGDTNAMEILDISDPMNPARLSTLAITEASDMQLVGDLLYVVSSDNFDDLYIVDVSDPADPLVLGTLMLEGRSYDLEVVENLVYIANGNQGLRIVDATDPSNPTLMNVTRGHEGGPIAFARGVDVMGDYAYVAATDLLQIYYVKNPYEPIELSWTSKSGNARDVVVVGSRAYVAESPDLVVYDLSSPHSPAPVATLDTGMSGVLRSLVVQYDRAYLARDYGWVVELDIDTCVLAGAADLSGDGVVDATDLAILIAAWGSTSAAGVDLDGDGIVSTSDLAILLAAWS